MSDDIIKFKNIGRNNQHPVNLFNIVQIPVSLEDALNNKNVNSQSFAENQLSYCANVARAYLKEKGFEETTGLFQLIDGKIIKYAEGMPNPFYAMPLWAVIEERDKDKGQTGEYLAALIDSHCTRLEHEWSQKWWEKSTPPFGFILDTAILIQSFFFDLVLLEDIQKPYSAGKARMNEANEERNLRAQYEKEAELIYRSYRENKVKKEDSYKKTASSLKKSHEGKKTPAWQTVKDWFKSRKDLP